MPQQAWNAKRERQYEHIKEGLEERGDSEGLASEIAARTVNKERARAGESELAEPRRRFVIFHRVVGEACDHTRDPVAGQRHSSTRKHAARVSMVAPR